MLGVQHLTLTRSPKVAAMRPRVALLEGWNTIFASLERRDGQGSAQAGLTE